MAKRRTRKQKIQAKHQGLSYTYEGEIAETSYQAATIARQATAKPEAILLYDYDTSLIIKDIFKTLYISLLIISIEIGLYLYLR